MATTMPLKTLRLARSRNASYICPRCESLPLRHVSWTTQHASCTTSTPSIPTSFQHNKPIHTASDIRTVTPRPMRIAHSQKRYAGTNFVTRSANSMRDQGRQQDVMAGKGNSQASALRDMIRSGDLPDDSPIFPGTLIMPTARDLWQQLKKEPHFRGKNMKQSLAKKKRNGEELTEDESKAARVLEKFRNGEKITKEDKQIAGHRSTPQMIRAFGGKQWERVKKKGQDFFSVIYYWECAAVSGTFNQIATVLFRKRDWGVMPARRRLMTNNCISLYTEMNASLFRNDADRIKDICCGDTAKELGARCRQQEKSGRSYNWSIVRLLSPLRCVSHRVTPQGEPGIDGSGYATTYRQAIFRVHSLQRLEPLGANPTSQQPREVEIDEYVVLQKRLYRGTEEPWKLWGTLQQASRVEDWDKILYPNPYEHAGKADAIAQSA